MKGILSIQIGAIIIVAIAFGAVISTTGIYSDVQDNIVKVLCLSCIKLEPKTSVEFTFETATGGPHPQFIRDALLRGPIMIMYSEDVCAACEEMYPVVKEILNVSFEKYEKVNASIVYHGTNMTFYFINIDHTMPNLRETRPLYDKNHVDGLPMFTFITLRYDEGTVRPYYTSVYGTVQKDMYDERVAFLRGILEDSIHLYHENRIGYQP
jgi:hypothetical protein